MKTDEKTITIDVYSCRNCPYVLVNEVTGYDGCYLSNEITEMYIHSGNMPEQGIHELCPLKNKELKINIIHEKTIN